MERIIGAEDTSSDLKKCRKNGISIDSSTAHRAVATKNS